MKLEKYLGVIAEDFEWFGRKFKTIWSLIVSAKFYWAPIKYEALRMC